MSQAALYLFSAQLIFVLGFAPTQVQHFVLGFVELHVVCTGPLLKPVKTLLDGSHFLLCVPCTTLFGVVDKLAEGRLNPTIRVANEDFQPSWSQCHL